MYLKSIELCGFKSFCSKTKIEFEPGISCIVGPNGSGKSNVADALRWVLGESSARSLRGSRMEDVIFSGTDKRRALGMAEVTVVLDNSDGYLPLAFSEVSVTRRAIRNGASEYFINQAPCRLRDIHDLFVDTGIGVDGISLINQGRINELVSARPEERRVLVEEAAGIVKYRERKREAARKLDETERHLERIGDIISELETRVGPLREQSDRAQKYLELKNDADNLEIGISVKVLSEAEGKISDIDQQLNTKEQSMLEKESLRLQAAADAEELRLRLAALDEAAAAANEAYFGLQTQREHQEGELRLLHSRLESSQSQSQRLSAELETDRSELEQRRKQQEEGSLQLSQLQARLEEQERLIASGEGGSEDIQEQVSRLSAELSTLQEEAAAAGAALAKAQQSREFQGTQADKARTALEQLEAEEQQLSLTLNAISERRKELAAQKEQAAAASGQLTAKLNESQLRLRAASSKIQDLAAEEADCRFQVHSLEARVNLLNEMAAGYEGFYPGVKGLLSAWRKGEAPDGIRGVMAELMDVPPELGVAVEAFLGANIQNIVCADAASARAAVDYLKQHHLGRATFLPLDILKVRRPLDISAVQDLPGVRGRASELISVAPDLRPAVDFLLNNLLLVDDMDAALAAAKKLDYRCSVATLDGDLVNPGASISGGSKGNKAGELLAKKARLEQAQSQLAALRLEAGQALQALEQARQSLQAENELNEQIGAELHTASQHLQDLQREEEQQDVRQDVLQEREQSLARDRQRLTGELNYAESAAAEADEDAGRWQTAADDLQQQLYERQEALQAAQSRLESSRQDMTDKKVAVAAVREKAAALSSELEKLAQSIEDLAWEAQDRSDLLDSLQKEQAAFSADIEAAEEALRDLSERMLEASRQLEHSREGLSAEGARQRELEQEQKVQQKAVDELKNDMHQLQLRRERWQADFENEAEKLAEKFQLDLQSARLRVGETPARTVMISRLNQLRREISGLGQINLGAIDEYREVYERYGFLTGQRDDMVEAKDKLNAVITEMDGIMAGRFRDTFRRLSAAFDGSFQRLFGGGSASLYLSQPDDLLETGVELRVDPPGKRVANYNLLSGGEKSLIGIALMFAVLEIRPTPFCVMDEVDAALDEANIDRFTAYLQDRSHTSQFVMISHRQSTMEAASALWGVTMEEKGISKVISVRLTAS